MSLVCDVRLIKDFFLLFRKNQISFYLSPRKYGTYFSLFNDLGTYYSLIFLSKYETLQTDVQRINDLRIVVSIMITSSPKFSHFEPKFSFPSQIHFLSLIIELYYTNFSHFTFSPLSPSLKNCGFSYHIMNKLVIT